MTVRESVLRAAAVALLDQPRASMEDLATRAGISRATLHRIVPSREALIDELGSHAIGWGRSALDAALLEEGGADAALGRAIHQLTRDAQLYWFLCTVPDSDIRSAWATHRQRLVRLFRRGQEEDVFRVDLPAEWLAEALNALLCSAAKSVHEGRLAPNDTEAMVVGLVRGGMLRASSVEKRLAAHRVRPRQSAKRAR
jgi:TetR/AcrR family transcriptional regulator, mexCD-oprJ operon repressor